MRKLYGFLVAMLLMLGALSTEVAQAQTYAMTDYVVRKVDAPDAAGLGSGSNWNEIQGTPLNEGYLGNYYQGYYYYGGLGHQMPFNVRFVNQQTTTANTFTITSCGSVVLSSTWVPSNYYGFYDGYNYGYGYIYGLNNGSNYQYEYDYGLYNSESGGTSYSNYILIPMAGYMLNYIPSMTANVPTYMYTVLGSAPNRELVVQALKQHSYQDYAYNSSNAYGSWQTVIYENAISAFQFNYGPTVGNPYSAPASSGATPFSFNGFVFPGSWCYWYVQNYGSYAYINDYRAVCGIKSTANQCIKCDWNGNGWDANRPIIYSYNNAHYGYYGGYSPVNNYSTATGAATQAGDNTLGFWPDTARYLPRSSIKFMIAYNYDATARNITVPVTQSIVNLGATITPTVSISNSGRLQPTSMQVLYQISPLGGAGPVYSQVVTLSGASVPAPFATINVTFPNFVVPAYGIYEDTVIIYNMLPTADQNPSDNTMMNEWTCSPPNNIKAVTVLGPAPGGRSPIAVTTPISIRFRNTGSADQFNVPLTCVVTDPSGKVVYRDTVFAPSIPSPNTDLVRSTLDTQFVNWVPLVNGLHKICGIAIMSNDQLRADDTACGPVQVAYEADMAANSIVNPLPDEEKPYTLAWQPQALFQSVGVSDLFDVPARIQIRRCSDGQLVFQADSIIPEVNVDQNLVRFYFPGKQGPYDVTKLTPGCYNVCAIARYPTDGDRTNDTACSTFSIIDRLKGNIYVGVNQRFQSIHAAVDSMAFRGVGGNLNLILTDANYTENGTYKVSSLRGALDFRGIRGLSDTSRVTWIPKPGVTSTITFTGNKPYCFYFGDLFGGYMTFEGYSPLGVPIADKLVPEPFKRGITIIDNMTVAGGIFGVELGASNMTFKDLRLISNGSKPNSGLVGGSMYANDSSAVIRLFNEQNFQSYIALVRDTVPIHNVRIENCEIGNAKYGIWEHGLHDQFELGPSTFKSWKDYNNSITRNTIGTASNPIGYAAISYNSVRNSTIAHNDIGWVDDSLTRTALGAYTSHAYGIMEPSGSQILQPGTIQDSVGNVVDMVIDANRIHNIRAVQGNAYGITFQQTSVIYQTAGTQPVASKLPSITRNRTSNNMLYDFRVKAGSVYPVTYMTASSKYTTDRDSIFNNSITTSNATVNITMTNTGRAFIWNNIIQNTGNAGSYTNYSLQVPRPFASSISADYNLFDLRAPSNPSTSTFATITEYDKRPTLGTILQTRSFRKINDWRTYVLQDLHSLTGDPMFASDSLHMPGAFSYISSPASNNGAWLGTASQALDFDGESRLTGNQTPDIGADEFEGFQYSNDLAVLSINTPGGYSAKSDTSLVTLENPMMINATVKNLSAQSVFNRTVWASVEVAISGGPWSTIYTASTPLQTWDVNEARAVTFTGPTLTPLQSKNGVFRVTVWVPTDQNHVNDSLSKVFKTILKTNATLVSYNGLSIAGRQSRDSVYRALGRLGITGYDTLDRNFYGSTDLDYTPYWTVIWVSGDPNVPVVAGQPTGQAGLSFKESQELELFLMAGQTYAKKSLIMAGQNIAFQNGFAMPNNNVTDTEFTNSWMHTKYVANTPVSGAYSGTITGRLLDYNSFPDNIVSASPDVVKPSMNTPTVGPEVNWWAYSYNTHPLTVADSGAGTTYRNTTYNTVFYGFDWSNPVQTVPGEQGLLTSGVTRILRGAIDFVASHAGTILPVDFTNATASRMSDGTSDLLKWSTTHQEDVARFEVETRQGNSWVNVGQTNDQHFTTMGLDAAKSYTYRIAAVDQSGAKSYSNEIESSPLAATGFTLEQNFPNPSSGVTSVHFTLPVSALVSLRVLDVTGKAVATEFANEKMNAGPQAKTLDVSELASGSYIYELTAVDENGQSVTLSKKMTLNK